MFLNRIGIYATFYTGKIHTLNSFWITNSILNINNMSRTARHVQFYIYLCILFSYVASIDRVVRDRDYYATESGFGYQSEYLGRICFGGTYLFRKPKVQCKHVIYYIILQENILDWGYRIWKVHLTVFTTLPTFNIYSFI